MTLQLSEEVVHCAGQQMVQGDVDRKRPSDQQNSVEVGSPQAYTYR